MSSSTLRRKTASMPSISAACVMVSPARSRARRARLMGFTLTLQHGGSNNVEQLFGRGLEPGKVIVKVQPALTPAVCVDGEFCVFAHHRYNDTFTRGVVILKCRHRVLIPWQITLQIAHVN